MHSTARRCWYPSDSSRAVRVLAYGADSERPLAVFSYRRADRRRNPSPLPAALAVGLGATRPGLCARCGPESTSVTAPGHHCWPGPVPPARTSPSRVAGWTSQSRVAGWVLTPPPADRFRSAGPAGSAPPALILGVSWASCWCGGSPEHTASVEPAARQLGSLSRSELASHRYRVRTPSGADSDGAVRVFCSATQVVTRACAPGTARQLQSTAKAGDMHGQQAFSLQ
jgi:hypothetical protein